MARPSSPPDSRRKMRRREEEGGELIESEQRISGTGLYSSRYGLSLSVRRPGTRARPSSRVLLLYSPRASPRASHGASALAARCPPQPPSVNSGPARVDALRGERVAVNAPGAAGAGGPSPGSIVPAGLPASNARDQ